MKNTRTKVSQKTINNTNRWGCDACGGDEETGCLMSDFQDCIRS
jgi:hypothetical protein